MSTSGRAGCNTGKVKFWNDEKGFGFIIPDSGEGDLFVHYSDINMKGRRTLEPDQQVTFEVEHGQRGPKAVNVFA